MGVYVDDMFVRFKGMLMCHLMADTLEELHDMAESIGLKRDWFQDTKSGPHYDVASSKRKSAIRNGAVEITKMQMAAYAWHLRTFKTPCDPTIAEAKMRDWMRSRRDDKAPPPRCATPTLTSGRRLPYAVKKSTIYISNSKTKDE